MEGILHDRLLTIQVAKLVGTLWKNNRMNGCFLKWRKVTNIRVSQVYDNEAVFYSEELMLSAENSYEACIVPWVGKDKQMHFQRMN